MASLKLSLRHADLLQVRSTITFLKHIEGTMSGPEIALDRATHGDLTALLRVREQAEFETLEADVPGGHISAYLVNFHTKDLPFSYRSVDRYARTMLAVSSRAATEEHHKAISFTTAIHGPGAGLDASEAMETLVRAFASELASNPKLDEHIREIVLVEREKEVFDRLLDRLRFLVEQHVLAFSDGAFLVTPLAAESLPDDERRVEELAKRHLFVAMPYAKAFDNVYYFGIKLPVEAMNRICERVDQDAFTGDIVDRIKTRIKGAKLVIADITGNNPNVFFEVGYAEGIGKTVILISQEQETPFDLKTRKQIRYDPQDLLALGEALKKQLAVSLAEEETRKPVAVKA